VVLDSAAASTVRTRQSAAAGAAVAMAACRRGRDGECAVRCAKAEESGEAGCVLPLLLAAGRMD
jgi:hypothetical protein